MSHLDQPFLGAKNCQVLMQSPQETEGFTVYNIFMNYRKFVNLFLIFLLINSSILVIYSVFFPNSTFLFFNQTYLEVLAIADTGGNGHLNLLTYPLSLYLMCTFGCIQYLRTQKIFYFNFLTILWTSVLVSRIITLLVKGNVEIDLYFFFGILTEFFISPMLIYLRSKLVKES